MDSIIIRQPDDFHLHLRDDTLLGSTVCASAGPFARALIMPNIRPPADNYSAICDYRSRIMAARPPNSAFNPLMAFYLTDATTRNELELAFADPNVLVVKYYPAGATTHSQNGVTDARGRYPIFEYMEKNGIPLSIHAETPNPAMDPFDREEDFIHHVLDPLTRHFPALKIICEHASTKELIAFVKESAPTVAATLTPHHLMLDRRALFAGGFNPHNYCLPILKTTTDQASIVEAALSGLPCFFAGTDSAPHSINAKLTGHAPAGIFNAPVALSIYASVFETHGALGKLENFCSRFGAEFYGLPLNSAQIKLTRSSWQVPSTYPLGSEQVVPMAAETILNWQWQILDTQ